MFVGHEIHQIRTFELRMEESINGRVIAGKEELNENFFL